MSVSLLGSGHLHGSGQAGVEGIAPHRPRDELHSEHGTVGPQARANPTERSEVLKSLLAPWQPASLRRVTYCLSRRVAQQWRTHAGGSGAS